MRLSSALILVDFIFLKLLWSDLIIVFSLLVLVTDGFLITKKGTCKFSTVLADSSDNSNFISIHPRNGISVWFLYWTRSLSHGFNRSPTSKILLPCKLLSSYFMWYNGHLGTTVEQILCSCTIRFACILNLLIKLLDSLILFRWRKSCVVIACFAGTCFPAYFQLAFSITASTLSIDNFCWSNSHTGS